MNENNTTDLISSPNMFNRVLPPPQTSSAQRQYEKERFKVQPGSIKDYSLGRGSLANRERQQVGDDDDDDDDDDVP